MRQSFSTIIKSHRTEAYVKGYTQALRDYAVWKNGGQTVGCGVKTLQEAIADAEQVLPNSPESYSYEFKEDCYKVITCCMEAVGLPKGDCRTCGANEGEDYEITQRDAEMDATGNYDRRPGISLGYD